MKTGVLPDFIIKNMIDNGLIKNANESNINPASLDLSISSKIYRVNGLFQVKQNEDVYDTLFNIGYTQYNLNYPLEKNVIYLIKLNESLTLPNNIYGFCNPKSSTGRNDIHVRVITEKTPRYDTITKGYNGDLWMFITPKSYPIKLNVGDKLTQIRFFYGDTKLTEIEFSLYLNQYKLIWNNVVRKKYPLRYENITISDNDGSFILTLGKFFNNVVGYKYNGCNKILDFHEVNFYDTFDFFEYIFFAGNNKYVYLKKDNFYILSSAESVMIPPHLACEMLPIDERSGDFRVHYAGFIDPGWGYGKNGEINGRPLTLELRPFEDIIIKLHQPIAKIKFDKMYDIPKELYDSKGNYKHQYGPKLSKHFKADY